MCACRRCTTTTCRAWWADPRRASGGGAGPASGCTRTPSGTAARKIAILIFHGFSRILIASSVVTLVFIALSKGRYEYSTVCIWGLEGFSFVFKLAKISLFQCVGKMYGIILPTALWVKCLRRSFCLGNR